MAGMGICQRESRGAEEQGGLNMGLGTLKRQVIFIIICFFMFFSFTHTGRAQHPDIKVNNSAIIEYFHDIQSINLVTVESAYDKEKKREYYLERQEFELDRQNFLKILGAISIKDGLYDLPSLCSFNSNYRLKIMTSKGLKQMDICFGCDEVMFFEKDQDLYDGKYIIRVMNDGQVLALKNAISVFDKSVFEK